MIGKIRETPWYGWLLVLVAFLSGLGLTLLILHTSKQANQNCEAINDGRQTIRAILTIAQQNSDEPNNPVWVEFFDRIKPLNCGTEAP
jgi:hypothetical protein